MASSIPGYLFISGALHCTSLYTNRYWSREIGTVAQTLALDSLLKQLGYYQASQYLDYYGWSLITQIVTKRLFSGATEGANRSFLDKMSYSYQEMLSGACLVASLVYFGLNAEKNQNQASLSLGAVALHTLYFFGKFWKEATAGFTPASVHDTLPPFITNLSTEVVQKRSLLVEREEEYGELVSTLLKEGQSNSVLLVGHPGCGKTELVKFLAREIGLGNLPQFRGYTVFKLDMVGLLSGTMYRGQFEDKVNQMIASVKSHGKAIVFVDEFHMVANAGATRESSAMSLPNMLKEILTDPNIRFIGATTNEEQERFLTDRAFNRRLTVINLDELAKKHVRSIIKMRFLVLQSRGILKGWFKTKAQVEAEKPFRDIEAQAAEEEKAAKKKKRESEPGAEEEERAAIQKREEAERNRKEIAAQWEGRVQRDSSDDAESSSRSQASGGLSPLPAASISAPVRMPDPVWLMVYRFVMRHVQSFFGYVSSLPGQYSVAGHLSDELTEAGERGFNAFFSSVSAVRTRDDVSPHLELDYLDTVVGWLKLKPKLSFEEVLDKARDQKTKKSDFSAQSMYV